MKVSTNSWHYKFARLMDVSMHHRHDLCSYMRGVAWAAMMASTFAIILGFVVFSMGYAMLAWLFGLDTNAAPFILGAAVWLVLSILGVGYVVQKMLDRRPEKSHKEPGVFKQWVTDRHNKVCRMVEFVD